jgi:cyclopropane fatty-acyl-phospholipid synthase-like methyltransferase
MRRWGDLKFYFREFLGQNVGHSEMSDHKDIAHVYNRGNDFYKWFLGDSMTYTCGMFQDSSESLEAAQVHACVVCCLCV